MYALVSGGKLVKYPVSLFEWRASQPLVSLPSEPTEAQLNEQGLYSVELSAPPPYDHTVNVEATAKLNANGKWQQEWLVTPASQKEITRRTSAKSEEVRKERNDKLAACDWTQLSDSSSNKAAWASYRQALRDLPSQQGFPWTHSWPIAPTN